MFDYDIIIVGGCGRIGLPLGLAFADKGLSVCLYDVDEKAVETVSSGSMPFKEEDADEFLKRLIDNRLIATTNIEYIGRSEIVLIVIGTPVDELNNPDMVAVPSTVEEILPYMKDGQLLVLRSTIFPGSTRLVQNLLVESAKKIDLAFCPERIAEGKALSELTTLPHIISGVDACSIQRAKNLFETLATTIELTPEEAELAKLFTNSWRYIRFAIANQLFIIATKYSIDYYRVLNAIREDYPRAQDIPTAGFVAGPCLLKDTLQLAAYNNNDFPLGQAAVSINEGLPLFLVSTMLESFDLHNMVIGILGMAFKSESDDIRYSLSYKLKKILRFKSKEILCHDPYVTSDKSLVELSEVLERADLIIIGSPHSVYDDISFHQPVIDVWGKLQTN